MATEPVYATREMVKRALDIAETARNNTAIDRVIRSASRDVEGLCHRRFYPEVATKKFDWPNIQGALPWRLWLDDTELVSVSSLVSTGGGTIPSTNYFLENNRTGPPYSRIEVNLSTSSAFGGGSTYQQSILVTGVWGYSNNETTCGLTAEVLDATETGVDVDGATSALVGVGSIIRVDSERMQVIARSMIVTGQVLGGSGLTSQANSTTVAVADGTQISVDETILIDSERMLVVDIAGNNLTVIRAWDGSVLAAHTASTAIYAARSLTVERGALGTTAATHLTAATVYRWDAPAGIQDYTVAWSLSNLLQEQTGWFRTMSASSNFGGTSRRAATLEAVQNLADRVYQQYGRKARQRTL